MVAAIGRLPSALYRRCPPPPLPGERVVIRSWLIADGSFASHRYALLMYDQIWYDPVMPTAEEQRMISEAKNRIAKKQESVAGKDRNDLAVTPRGCLISLLLAATIVAATIASLILIV